MVKDAEKFAADDEKRKEQVEVSNQADNLVYATEKALKDYGDKVNQTERAAIEASINDLKSAIKDKNIDRIKKGMEDLTKASHKLAEEIYKQSAAKQQQGQQAGAQPGPQQEEAQPREEKKSDDVIDAEFKDEDEGKK
jgi:molecular chaperone DnaK